MSVRTRPLLAVALAAFASLSAVPPAHADRSLDPEAVVARAERLLADGDPAPALALLDRVGRNWYPEADYRLGVLYLEGDVVARDPAKAAFHLGRAAKANWMRVEYKRGHPGAQHALASLLASGEAGATDPRTPYRLHKAAARMGHAGSQLALARAYATGAGTGVDPERAYRWSMIAARAIDAQVSADAAALASQLRERIALGLAERIEREAARFEPVDPA